MAPFTGRLRQGFAVRARWLIALSVGAVGFTGVTAHSNGAGPPCLFKYLYHIPCPGCGITRSFQAMWRGDWTYAFKCHLLGPPLFVFLCCIIIYTGINRLLPGRRHGVDRLTAAILHKRTVVSVTANVSGSLDCSPRTAALFSTWDDQNAYTT